MLAIGPWIAKANRNQVQNGTNITIVMLQLFDTVGFTLRTTRTDHHNTFLDVNQNKPVQPRWQLQKLQRKRSPSSKGSSRKKPSEPIPAEQSVTSVMAKVSKAMSICEALHVFLPGKAINTSCDGCQGVRRGASNEVTFSCLEKLVDS